MPMNSIEVVEGHSFRHHIMLLPRPMDYVKGAQTHMGFSLDLNDKEDFKALAATFADLVQTYSEITPFPRSTCR